MLNELIIKLLGTYSHRYIVPYNRVNNVTIKVMISKQINRIRLPTCEVEYAKIMYYSSPPRKSI